MRRFFFGGLIASIFGIAVFVFVFIFAINLGIEETTVNMIVLWATIIALVVSFGVGGLILGFKHCDSLMIRPISLGIPITLAIAGAYAWFFTEPQLGIGILALLLLPASGIIAGCAFVASLCVYLWLKRSKFRANAV